MADHRLPRNGNGGDAMIRWLLSQILGPFLPIIAGAIGALGLIFFGRRSAKKDERLKRAEADVKAMKTRQEIDDNVQQEPDLVDRARKSGVLRRGK